MKNHTSFKSTLSRLHMAGFTFGLIMYSSFAWAQKAAISDIPTGENTTISIKKGDAAIQAEKQYEIVEGTGHIEGEPHVLTKEARANWTKACDQWKREIRETNHDSKVMVTDCGKVTCEKQGTEGQVCQSEGSYKIKTKVN